MIHLGSRGLAKSVSCVFLKEKILTCENVSRESAQRVGSTGPT